jgi:hypothetical protein
MKIEKLVVSMSKLTGVWIACKRGCNLTLFTDTDTVFDGETVRGFWEFV